MKGLTKVGEYPTYEKAAETLVKNPQHKDNYKIRRRKAGYQLWVKKSHKAGEVITP